MSRGGRGRGKGKGSQLSFNVDAIGLGRGEQLPAPTLQPPPKFPPLQIRPHPLSQGPVESELIEIKQNFLTEMRNSPYFIKAEVKDNGIKRYSDKYKTQSVSDSAIGWQPDWSRFPSELKINVSKRKKNPGRKFPVNLANIKHEDVVKRLESLEKDDVEDTGEAKKTEDKDAGSDDDEIALDDVVQDDEVYEEENDYHMSYFDNGDDFVDDDEDGLEDKDGGIY